MSDQHILQSWLFITVFLLTPIRALGQTTFSEARPVEAPGLHDLAVTDFDGDGDADLVAITANDLVWLENDGTGQFAPAHTLLADLPSELRTLKAADLDGNGNPDLLMGHQSLFEPGGLFWVANEDGQVSALQVIEPVNSGVFIVVDFDSDGDLDVLQGGLYVSLYENTGEARNNRFRHGHALAPGPSRALAADDFDGDGDVDLIASQLSFEGRNDVLFPYEQREPGPFRPLLEREMMSFPRQQGLYKRLISVMETADINRDGQLDVVIGAYLDSDVGPVEGRLDWYENRSFGRAPLFLQNGLYGGSITSEQGGAESWGPGSLAVADFDGDGDVDVAISKASHGPDSLVWYEHPGEGVGAEATWTEHPVGISTGILKSIYGVDLNLDGNVDLISFELVAGGGRIVWYENLGGTGTDTDATETLPYEFGIRSIWPNPSSGAITVTYQLAQPVRVRLEMFDVLGRMVATVVDEMRAAGTHKTVFDASHLPSGTYVYRLTADDFIQTKSVVLMK